MCPSVVDRVRTKSIEIGRLDDDIMTYTNAQVVERYGVPDAAREVMGDNALRQLVTVVPDFFSGRYVVTRMDLSPEQPEGLTEVFYKNLHPEVVGSDVDDFPSGSVFKPKNP